ncbi:MAG: hypothetical protein JNK15_17590 [Planctomycetes bacterium]|nr:hypothetical protein [Planctomycetota bacterium]
MALGRCITCLAFAACAPSSFEPGRATRADVLLEWGEPVLSFARDTELVYAGAGKTDHSSSRPPGHFYSGSPLSLRVMLEQHRLMRLPRACVFVFDANGTLVENR